LNSANHDVFAAFPSAHSLSQHLRRLPYTRSVAQEDLQPAAPFAPLLLLDFSE
jgi:hypothetical protein